jgi:hypothetical protein
MRVTDAAGRDLEAFGPSIHSGIGFVWTVNGEQVPLAQFRERYTCPTERRHERRRTHAGRRWRDEIARKPDALPHRNGDRRQLCRRLRDRLTEREILAMVRGPEWVRVLREGGV